MKGPMIGAALLMAALPMAASAQDNTTMTGTGVAAGDAAAESSSMPIWPWVGGGLVATAVGVAVAAGSDGNGHKGGTTTTTTTTGAQASDIRLKRDIVRLGQLDNGLHLYRYRYIWSDTEYVGVMAQEVEKVFPAAVVRRPDGFLAVHYDRLGLQLETWDEWTATH